MPKRNILCLILCIFLISIITSACGDGDSNTFIIVPPIPSKYPLELSKTEFKLNIGFTDNIIVTLNGEDVTKTATYKVDQESIAKVEGGLITGLSVGLATVTVSAENAESDATFTVNVVDPVLPSLVVDPSIISVNVDNESEVKVTLEGKEVTEDVSYISDDDSIAIVDKGIVKGLKIGNTNVTVSLEGANSAVFTVNVVDSAVPSLVVDPSVISVNFDDELKVKVTLDGKDVTEDVSYTSDDDSIATVDKGIIKGLKIGNTNVTASLEGANSAVFIVNVNPFANRNVGDEVEFGHYPQSKVEGSDPPEYQVDPIKWRVLKRDDYNKKVLAVSVNGLYAHRFDDTSEVWEDSEIYSSLNGDDFYNGKFNDIPVFDEFEREIISLVRVENDVVYFGGDTHVFLLGAKDANNTRYFVDEADRLCKPTDYAKHTGASVEDGNCYWWLRTTYSGLTGNVYCIAFDGKIYFIGVHLSYLCARPALWINL